MKLFRVPVRAVGGGEIAYREVRAGCISEAGSIVVRAEPHMIVWGYPEEVKLGYVGFYKGKRWEGYAPSLLAAKEAAMAFFKVHRARGYLVSVMLAEKGGVPVIHSGAAL